MSYRFGHCDVDPSLLCRHVRVRDLLNRPQQCRLNDYLVDVCTVLFSLQWRNDPATLHGTPYHLRTITDTNAFISTLTVTRSGWGCPSTPV